MHNPLDASARIFGVIILCAAIAGLIAIEAWGALAFIVIGTPIVMLLERWLRPELYR